MSLKEVAVCTGHKVLMEVDDNILPIVGDHQGIFDLPNFAIIFDYYIKLNIFKSFKKTERANLQEGGLALLQALGIQNKRLGGTTTLNITTLSITTLNITTLSITTLNITTLSITTLSIMTLSIMTFSIMTISIRSFYVTLIISDSQHK
jgi:hypothetical protein